MKNNGVVEVDLGGKLQLKTGIGNIVFNEGKLDITWVDEKKAIECLQFAIAQRQFAFALRMTGAIEFETDDARVTGFGYNSKEMNGLLFLTFG